MTEKKEFELKERGNFWSDALIIALLTFLGYALGFAFELGRSQFYRIPIEFIALDITRILLSIAVLLSVLIYVFYSANFIYLLFSKASRPILKAINSLSLPFCIFLGTLILFREEWRFWVVFLLLLLCLAFIEFIYPLFTQKNIDGYANKLQAQQDVEIKIDTLLNVAARSVGRSFLRAGIWITLLIPFAYATGEVIAKRQNIYYVDKRFYNSAIVAIYGDKIINAIYDNNMRITGHYIITKTSENVPIEIHEYPIGRLKKYERPER